MYKILDHSYGPHFDIAPMQGHHAIPAVLYFPIGLLQVTGKAKPCPIFFLFD